MKLILSLFIVFVTSVSLFSQDLEEYRTADGRINDAKLVHAALERKYPGFNESYNQWHKQVATLSVNESGRSIIEIPVVVHIVWKYAAENISQANIDAQIDIMNKAYERKNADTVNMRSIYNPIAGNPQIKFVLAGVERVQTNNEFYYDDNGANTLYDEIKSNNTGGSDAWNTSNYMNIWVGNLQEGFLLGYAYPPSGAPGWGGAYNSSPDVDGVVIDYRAFGPNTYFYGVSLRGKTCVHESGHYLGLRHIWGDTDVSGNPSCSTDDNVSDTPIAYEASNFDCDKTKNSCNQGSGDLPDMVENYMDYSSNNCQNSFTKGQANFMRTVVQNYRPGLLLTTNVAEHSTGSLTVYPNPTNGVLHYSLVDFSAQEILITDITGKLVLTKKTTGLSIGRIDVSALNKGTYLFTTLNSNGNKITKRFFVK